MKRHQMRRRPRHTGHKRDHSHAGAHPQRLHSYRFARIDFPRPMQDTFPLRAKCGDKAAPRRVPAQKGLFADFLTQAKCVIHVT
jgi:hypothetical protein